MRFRSMESGAYHVQAHVEVERIPKAVGLGVGIVTKDSEGAVDLGSAHQTIDVVAVVHAVTRLNRKPNEVLEGEFVQHTETDLAATDFKLLVAKVKIIKTRWIAPKAVGLSLEFVARKQHVARVDGPTYVSSRREEHLGAPLVERVR